MSYLPTSLPVAFAPRKVETRTEAATSTPNKQTSQVIFGAPVFAKSLHRYVVAAGAQLQDAVHDHQGIVACSGGWDPIKSRPELS